MQMSGVEGTFLAQGTARAETLSKRVPATCGRSRVRPQFPEKPTKPQT